uniref:NADH-ubiquinone oxidoreductase chain 1 n=1 Tax=Orseolia oryzae TaxID=33408 RepID=A0A0K0M773_9DIPT|nr:NADH dehydrogenase subunit 1 [Orseolia oryzae]
MFLLYLFFIMIMISITFLTLLEQKILSYIQIRKGPNKVSFMGLLQPFSDAIKLFFKEFTLPIYSNYLIYYLCPLISFSVSLFIWCSFPFLYNLFSFNLMFLFVFSCMSIGVYFVMFSGWSSNSNYSLLGSLRAVAQTISYEVCMILFFICFFILVMELNMKKFMDFQEIFSFFLLNLLISFIFFIIFLAETNRSPFDFAEGESELVSGFNIEYSSGGFALIFLSEYSMILFLSMIFNFMFLFNSFIYLFIFMKLTLISFMFILVRGSFPRFRYDKLMYLTWKLYLPISLFYIIFMLDLKF